MQCATWMSKIRVYLRLIACEKYCMHLFPLYLLVIWGCSVFFFFSLRLFIAPKILRYFIKNIFVLSFGKSLSIERMKDFLHHTNNWTKKRAPWKKSLLVHFSLTNIKLTWKDDGERFEFYLPLVNNWNAKVIRKRNVFRMASSDSVFRITEE